MREGKSTATFDKDKEKGKDQDSRGSAAAIQHTIHVGSRVCPSRRLFVWRYIPPGSSSSCPSSSECALVGPSDTYHAGGLFFEKAERTLCCPFAAILRLANLASGSRLPALMLSRTLVGKEEDSVSVSTVSVKQRIIHHRFNQRRRGGG